MQILLVDILWEMFKSKIDEGIHTFIPFKTTKSRDSHPWIHSELKCKICWSDKALKRCKKSSSRDTDERKFQRLKCKVQREQHMAYWQYVEDIFILGDDPTGPSGKKKFYKFIKHNKSDFNGVAGLKVDGKLISDPKGKADALNQHFQSVFTQKTNTIIDSESPYPTLPSIPPITVTVPGVLKLLKRLDPSKSSGPDNIGPRVL